VTQASGAETAAAIRAEYEAVGAEVRAELAKLTPADFSKATGNDGWTVQKVAAHLAGSPGSLSAPVRRVASGKGFPKIPAFVLNIGNAVGSFRSRNMTAEKMASTYEEGHRKLLGVIADAAGTADWEKKLGVFGESQSLSDVLRNFVIKHETEHLEQLKARPA